mmetsp:Transcript_19933/g.35558  ORF Transcript_19933/g.35558 Transcript_19933/m.35558 type:complete len:264 (-) Transcript_19933:471-1262(-)
MALVLAALRGRLTGGVAVGARSTVNSTLLASSSAARVVCEHAALSAGNISEAGLSSLSESALTTRCKPAVWGNGRGFASTASEVKRADNGTKLKSAAYWRAQGDIQRGTVDVTPQTEGGRISRCLHQFEIVGRIEADYEIPAATKFAVVEIGAHQFKVAAGDVIITEKLNGVDVNDKLSLTKVLMLGSAKETVIGRPQVPGAYVIAAVEEQFLDAKKLIFKFRRRKNSKTLKGHRQPLTNLRILEVVGIDADESAAEEAESVA